MLHRRPSFNPEHRTAMPCLCFGRRRKDDTPFHWSNFTFSHSQQSFRPRRIHSTFSLQEERRKPRRVLKRKDTIQSEPTFSTFWKPRKSGQSLAPTESDAAAAHESRETSNQRCNLPDSSPITDVIGTETKPRHVHWAGAGS
jgi:hypothetical protein